MVCVFGFKDVGIVICISNAVSSQPCLVGIPSLHVFLFCDLFVFFFFFFFFFGGGGGGGMYGRL